MADLKLNITVSGTSTSETRTKKLKKPDRLKQKKQTKVQDKLALEQQLLDLKSKAKERRYSRQDNRKQKEKTEQRRDLKSSSLHDEKQKPPRRSGEFSKKLDTDHLKKPSKFSSIFKNNPELPSIVSKSIKARQEDLFTTKRFSELPLHQFLISNLEKKQELSTMTTVQQHAIPKILDGRDVLVKSQTGSGKTLAYAVPIMQKLQAMKPSLTRHDGIHTVVIVPTRELAVQSLETFHKLTQSFINIVPGALMGGENRNKEKARLRKGVTVLVATPGRLVDHLENTNCLCLQRVKHLIIDEADRLLDMGFERDVSRFIKTLKQQVQDTLQTVLLSATLSAGVERLAGMTLTDPLHVNIMDTPDVDSDTFATPSTLKHHYVLIPSKLRLVTLFAFILWKCKYTSHDKKMLVFFATQDSVEFYHKVLQGLLADEESDLDESLSIYKLHGDMQQKDRNHVFKAFSDADSGVLLCTDVAARGLDLPQVRWIVQYNTPEKATDYIHRVGRTARAGSVGHALIFLTPNEAEYVKVLQEINIGLSALDMMVILKTLIIFVQNNPRLLETGARCSRSVEECATAIQKKIEDTVLESRDLRTLARKAYQSFVRAYATYPANLKHIFHIKNLHLGHVAKSFGLQESPAHIGVVVSNTYMYSHKAKQEWMRKRSKLASSPSRPVSMKRPRLDLISEYDSGLNSSQKPKQRPKQIHKAFGRRKLGAKIIHKRK